MLHEKGEDIFLEPGDADVKQTSFVDLLHEEGEDVFLEPGATPVFQHNEVARPQEFANPPDQNAEYNAILGPVVEEMRVSSELHQADDTEMETDELPLFVQQLESPDEVDIQMADAPTGRRSHSSSISPSPERSSVPNGA